MSAAPAPVGLFIVLEGLDGSGKDTVLDQCFRMFYLEQKHNSQNPMFISKYQNVLRTREPTMSSSAGIHLAAMLSGLTLLNHQEDALRLYVEDRRQHSAFIRQCKSHRIAVLCSRYDLSTYAYQHVMGFSLDEIYSQHSYSAVDGCLIPDLTLFFDLDAETAVGRIKSSGRQIEALESYEFLSKTRIAYLKSIDFLKKKDNRDIAVINASQSPDDVAAEACRTIGKKIESFNSRKTRSAG